MRRHLLGALGLVGWTIALFGLASWTWVWADGVPLKPGQRSLPIQRPDTRKKPASNPRAKTTQQAVRPKPHLRLEGSGFYYSTDWQARYYNAKQQWRSANPGRIPGLAVLTQLAWQAYEPAQGQSVERLLPRWQVGEDPAPWVLRPKVLLRNTHPTQTELDLTLVSSVEAQVGSFMVHPQTMLADLGHLAKTSRWVPLYSKSVSIAVLAANDEQQVDLPPIQLLQLFREKENLWPLTLRLNLQLRAQGHATQVQPVRMTLRLVPDYTALPLYLY